MDYWIISALIILGIIAILFATGLVKKELAKRKAAVPSISEDIIKDFELAEKMLKESNGNKSPQEILFEIGKMKGGLNLNNGTGREINTGTDSGTIVQTEPRAQTTDSTRELEGRSDIQKSVVNSDTEHIDTTGNAKSEDNFFSRFKRNKK